MEELNPFEGSRRKIARAKKHLEDLEREAAAFFAEHPYALIRDPDPNNPKHEIHKIRFNKRVPDSIASLTEEAVHHLRSALDNACYSVAVASGLTKPRHTAFPFSGSAAEFENALKGRC